MENLVNVGYKFPLIVRVITWVWNLLSIVAIGSCIYAYVYIKPTYNNLKEDVKAHKKYKDSIDISIKFINGVVKDKTKEAEDSEIYITRIEREVKLYKKKLLINTDYLKDLDRLRDSINLNNKRVLTDEEREIYLTNRFYPRDTIPIPK